MADNFMQGLLSTLIPNLTLPKEGEEQEQAGIDQKALADAVAQQLQQAKLPPAPVMQSLVAPARNPSSVTTKQKVTIKAPIQEARQAPVIEEPMVQEPAPVMPSNVYGEGLEDKDIKAAQKKAEMVKLFSLLNKAGSEVGAGVGGLIGGSTITPDEKGLDDFAALEESKVKDIATRRAGIEQEAKFKNTKLDLEDETMLRDPNSAISKSLRDAANLFNINVPANVSAKQLRDSGVNLGALLAAHEASEARKAATISQEITRKEGVESRQHARESLAEERTDTKVEKLDQKFKESTGNLATARTMVEQALTNQQAAKNLPRAIIKAIEGSGARVSDKDFSSAVGGGAAGTIVLDTLNKLRAGTIRKITKDELESLLDASEKVLNGKFQESRDLVLKNHARRQGKDFKEVLEERGYKPADEQSQEKSEYTPAQENGIAAYMKAKGYDRETAIKKLKDAKRLP